MNKAEELLARTSKLLAEMKKPLPLSKSDPKKIKNKKEKKEKKEGIQSGKGYIYTYDENGKPIPKGRALMEEKLGRPLHEYEVVIYLDKDRRNCEIENLAIGFKQNSPITSLVCKHCGTVGEISFVQDD